MDITQETVILASSSPRRIKMMNEHGIDPIIIPPDVDESLPEEMGMEQAVMYLALKKALYVEELIKSAQEHSSLFAKAPIIIAADTVVFKNHIIGKPKNPEEATEILHLLHNQSHFVATGVCLLRAGRPERKVFWEETKVFFTEYSHMDIQEYVHTQEPYDKAGGYAIQGAWGKYVSRIEGDFDNVVGFPWTRILQESKSWLPGD